MGNGEKNKESELECPLCGGKGSVETVDEEGAAREVVCPVCEGRGTVSAKRARYVLGKVSGRFSGRCFFPRHGRGGGGGRFRQPRSVQLPLTMDPRAGAQDGIGVERRGRSSAGGRIRRPRPVKRSAGAKDRVRPEEYPYGAGTGAETGPDSPVDMGLTGREEVTLERPEAELETVLPEETLELGELWQPEMELQLAESLPDEQVTREFSAADAQLEVEQPEVPELIQDETAEATLEVTHDSLVGDLDYRIEPYPTELFEQEVDHDPLDDEPGPGMLPPPSDIVGLA
jgi:hypothetical protein